MSATPSLAYSPDYWTYMAQVMVLDMNDIIKARRVVSDDIAKGIYSHSKLFFDLAINGKDYNSAHPQNREAHYTFFKFICSLPQFKGATEEKPIDDFMNEMYQFHESLLNDRELNDEEIQSATFLLRLYQRLAREGEDDRRRSRGPGCY